MWKLALFTPSQNGTEWPCHTADLRRKDGLVLYCTLGSSVKTSSEEAQAIFNKIVDGLNLA